MNHNKHQTLTSIEDIEPMIASVQRQIRKSESGHCRLEEGLAFTVMLTQEQARIYSNLGYIDEVKCTEHVLSQKGIAEAIQLTIDFAQQDEQHSTLQGQVLDLRRILEGHVPAEVLNAYAGDVSEILGDESIVSLQLRKSKLERAIASNYACLGPDDSNTDDCTNRTSRRIHV